MLLQVDDKHGKPWSDCSETKLDWDSPCSLIFHFLNYMSLLMNIDNLNISQHYIFSPYSCFLAPLQQTTFENIVAKGEIVISPFATMCLTLFNNYTIICRDNQCFRPDLFKVICCRFVMCGKRITCFKTYWSFFLHWDIAIK